jgi:hypothetical protein
MERWGGEEISHIVSEMVSSCSSRRAISTPLFPPTLRCLFWQASFNCATESLELKNVSIVRSECWLYTCNRTTHYVDLEGPAPAEVHEVRDRLRVRAGPEAGTRATASLRAWPAEAWNDGKDARACCRLCRGATGTLPFPNPIVEGLRAADPG